MSRPAFAHLTPEELEAKISAHWEAMTAQELPHTIEGLAEELGVDKHSLARYRKHDPKEAGPDHVYNAHCAPIKRAYVHTERWLANKLHLGGSPVGAIFALKCGYGWQETPTKIDLVGGFSMVVDTSAADEEG